MLQLAKVVVAVFDENQILQTNQYWEQDLKEQVFNEDSGTVRIRLQDQIRTLAAESTINWVRNLIDYKKVTNLAVDSDGYDTANYEVKFFDDPKSLHQAIVQKEAEWIREQNIDSNSVERSSLSRLVATYDWGFINNRKPEETDTWNVVIGDFTMPWNLQMEFEGD